MKIIFFLILFFSGFSSYGEKFPFPLMSSFGGAGRAAQGSAEYHILNAATIMQRFSQATGFYSFSSKKDRYGVSISSKTDIPLAITWAQLPPINYRVFSIAGRLNQRWALGTSLHYLSDQTFIPHLGLLYSPFKKLRMAVTGDHIKKEMLYGFGLYYEPLKKVRILGDITYMMNTWKFQGGVELQVQNVFSLRAGVNWPEPRYRAGISFISFPMKVDYTWLQHGEHYLGLRIHSASL